MQKVTASSTIQEINNVVENLTPKYGELGGRVFVDESNNEEYSYYELLNIYKAVKDKPDAASLRENLNRLYYSHRKQDWKDKEKEDPHPYLTKIRNFFHHIISRITGLHKEAVLGKEIEQKQKVIPKSELSLTPPQDQKIEEEISTPQDREEKVLLSQEQESSFTLQTPLLKQFDNIHQDIQTQEEESKSDQETTDLAKEEQSPPQKDNLPSSPTNKEPDVKLTTPRQIKIKTPVSEKTQPTVSTDKVKAKIQKTAKPAQRQSGSKSMTTTALGIGALLSSEEPLNK